MGKADFIESVLAFETRLERLENIIFLRGEQHPSENRTELNLCKCKSALNKIETAHLFYFLMDEGLLFFDLSDKRKNRTKFQHFVSANFTYAGEEGSQSKITAINKQFSECKGFTYREKQIRFLERLISLLSARRNKLADW